MSYICQYRKYYPDPYEFVWDDLPMEEGYAMINGARMMDGWLQFAGIVLADGGYLKQEVDKKHELPANHKP